MSRLANGGTINDIFGSLLGFSDGEITLLRDVAWGIGKRGEPTQRPQAPSTLAVSMWWLLSL